MLYNRISNLNPIMECTQRLTAAWDKVKVVSDQMWSDIRQFFNHILFLCQCLMYWLYYSPLTPRQWSLNSLLSRGTEPVLASLEVKYLNLLFRDVSQRCEDICFYLSWLWPRLFDLNLKHCLIKLPQRKMQLVSFVLQRNFVRFLDVIKYFLKRHRAMSGKSIWD